MKPFNVSFKKINLICLSFVVIFSIFGVSYCSWDDGFAVNHNFKTGNLELELNDKNEMDMLDIDIVNDISNYIIPFTIKNNCTIPIKVKNVSCKLYNDEINEVCIVDFKGNTLNGESDIINANLELDLRKINEIILHKENVDVNSITEPIDVKTKIDIEIEFIQANVNKNGWYQTINFDIDLNKTIQPEIIPTLVIEDIPIISEPAKEEEVINSEIKVIDDIKVTDDIKVIDKNDVIEENIQDINNNIDAIEENIKKNIIEFEDAPLPDSTVDIPAENKEMK